MPHFSSVSLFSFGCRLSHYKSCVDDYSHASDGPRGDIDSDSDSDRAMSLLSLITINHFLFIKEIDNESC